ncbi:MAG TPA: CHAT domain-containing protein [Micromonosporaceae bacterium]
MSEPAIARAAALHAAGVTASNDMRPAAGARLLRTALRMLNGGATDAADQPEAAQLRARILVSLAYAVAEQGNTDAGLRHLDDAERLLPPQRRGVLYGQRAVLLRRTGRHDEALEQYDQALRVLDERLESKELARVLLNRAVLYIRAARLRPARADLTRASGLALRHGFPLIATKARHNLALLDLVAGDLPAALGGFASLTDEYARSAPGVLPLLGLDRARALLAAGLFKEADAELAASHAQLRAQGMNQDEGEALVARAEAALLAGRPANASQWAGQARRCFTRRQNHRWSALAELVDLRAAYAMNRPGRAILNRGRSLSARLAELGLDEDARVAGLLATRVLAARGPSTEVAESLRRYGVIRRVDRLDTRLLCRLTRAEFAEATGRAPAAARQLATGLRELHRYQAQFGCLDLQSGAAVHGRDLAAAGVRRALRSGSPAAIYRWSERSRAQALLLPPVHPPDDAVTAAALEELRQRRLALREAELAGRPTTDLRTRCWALERLIRHRSWATSGPDGGVEPAALAKVQSALGDMAMVIYVNDGAALRALVLVQGSAQLSPVGTVGAAEEAVLRLRADLDAVAGRELPARLAAVVRDATRRDARALADAVLMPLLAAVGDRDLVIVPTGGLMTALWPLLPGCAGRPITVAPSATSWLTARRRLLDPAPAAKPPALIAGPGNDRGELEVRHIAALYPTATVLTDQAATVDAAAAAIDGAALAHVAAHGRHRAENPLFSCLELADGPLMGHHMQRLVTPPPVAILSSCELGLSDHRPGDESIGMSTALLAAGTATVIASVSRVPDEAAMRAMVTFHRALVNGARPAAALTLAVTADDPLGFLCIGAG